MPGLRIAVGVGFLSLAVLSALNGSSAAGLLIAVAGAAFLLDGIILLRLR